MIWWTKSFIILKSIHRAVPTESPSPCRPLINTLPLQRSFPDVIVMYWSFYVVTLWRVSVKSSPFYFYDKFPNCKPLQIIFGRNIAEKIWNKLTKGNFNISSLCVASLHRKMSLILFFQFQNVKNFNVAFQTVFTMMILSWKLFSSVCKS